MYFEIVNGGTLRYDGYRNGKKLKNKRECAIHKGEEIVVRQRHAWLSRFWWLFSAIYVIRAILGREAGNSVEHACSLGEAVIRVNGGNSLVVTTADFAEAISVEGGEVVSRSSEDKSEVVRRRIKAADIALVCFCVLVFAAIIAFDYLMS